jgi:hypothetical protein
MFGFLANLGSGLAKIGSGFAHGAAGIGKGAASVGKGIGHGFKRLGQLGAGEDDLGPGGTPGFNPNAGYSGMTPGISPDGGRGVRMLEDAVATAENDARADSLLERRYLPIAPPSMPGGPPPLSPAPSLAELSSSLPSLPSRPTTPPMIARSAPPVSALPDLVPDMDIDRRNVPIPRLPGKSGAPTPYNTIDAAKYDYVMGHAKRDAEGDLIPKSEGGGFSRDWGMTLRNALLGASAAASSARPGEDPIGRAIGGAAAASVGSAINPEAGYEFNFDVGQRPKLEAETARAREEQARQRAERMADLDIALKQGQVYEIPRKAERELAEIDLKRAAERRQAAVAQSQIDLNNARAKATATGNPQKVDVFNPEKNVVETVLVYPDNRREVVGPSGQATLAERHDAEAMKRTRVQEGGANARNAATIAGAKDRLVTKINADKEDAEGAGGSKLRKSSGEGKTATMGQLREFYKARGITDDAEIRRRAKEHGVNVKD